MLFNFLVSSVALMGVGAAQADTGDPEPQPAAREEITVYGDAEILRRRGEVIRNLRHLGYREARRSNGRTVMVPKVPYKPTVILDDDAWMQVKRTPIRVDPPGDTNWRYLWCLPPFTITSACIQVGGQVIGRRKLNPFKEDVVRATRYEMRAWQNAVVSHAMEQRLNKELPDMLDATWTSGKPMGDDGPFLESHEARRSAMFAFWASRSCTPEGDQVREVVATFINAEVQNSSHPATPNELSEANTVQRCEEANPFDIP